MKEVFIKYIYLIQSLYRLVVRTLPFHGRNTGSNPVKDINNTLNLNLFQIQVFLLKYFKYCNIYGNYINILQIVLGKMTEWLKVKIC